MRTRRAPAAHAAPGDDDAQIRRLAALVRDSRHVVFCTGAGISTNAPAGLRDYRGPDGIWTEAQSAGLVVGEPGAKGTPVDCPWDASMFERMPAAEPTIVHRAIAMLAEGDAPLVKHVISQNEDGLHRRSGLAAERLSELHGNAFIELCGRYESDDSDSDLGSDDSSSSSDDDGGARVAADKAARAASRARRPAGCGAAVVRDFVTYHPDTYRRSWLLGRHVTGRACPHCRGAPSPEAAEAASRAHAQAAAAERARDAGDRDDADGPGGGLLEGAGWLLDTTVDFGECPAGFPWGASNPVHNLAAAKRAMQHADLVVAWGTSLSILANYFDPWCPASKWSKPPPRGLRLATTGEATAGTAGEVAGGGGGSGGSGGGEGDARASKRSRPRPGRVSRCRLAIVNKGATLDEELAELKIERDVDEVAAALLAHLGLPAPPPYDARRDPLLAAAVDPAPGEPRSSWRIPRP